MSTAPPATFVPWMSQTILKHECVLADVVLKSFLPGNPAAAFTSTNLLQVAQSLESTASCKLCQLLHSICTHLNPPVSFYGDYASICYYAIHAPKTWTANLALFADFVELITTNFPTTQFNFAAINGADIYLHFFVNRCFKPITMDKILQVSDLNLIKVEFLRACLTGALTGTFCFKNVWPSIFPNAEVKKDTCPCDRSRPSCAEVYSSQETSVFKVSRQSKANFLDLVLVLWKDSELLSEQNKRLAEALAKQLKCFSACRPTVSESEISESPELDITQGPCLLGPSFNLAKKNNTSTLCFLCECLASHCETKAALQTLKDIILSSFGNNVNLIDRILFLLQDQDALSFISDSQLLRPIIQNCTPQEIHKHLFCDPLCALNATVTNPEVLFSYPNTAAFQDFKTTLATGLYLNQGSASACEFLETLIFMFKGIQNTKAGKTTILEIIKETEACLKKHGIQVLNAYHTFQIYK